MLDRDDAGIDHASAARATLRAVRGLAGEAASRAERRCFEAVACRIQRSLEEAGHGRGARIGLGGASRLAVALRAGPRDDRAELARADLRRRFWPREATPAREADGRS